MTRDQYNAIAVKNMIKKYKVGSTFMVTLEEYAGTDKDFVRVAKTMGLECVAYGDNITMKRVK